MAAVTWAVHIHIYTHIVSKMDACILLTYYLIAPLHRQLGNNPIPTISLDCSLVNSRAKK